MRKIALIWLLAWLSAPAAAADATYLAELQESARRGALADDVYWRKLLHYRATPFTAGLASTIDAQDFFLSPQGPRDPHAELMATLASFFDSGDFHGEPSQCRKKARYEWLKRRLKFDNTRLLEAQCELYGQYEVQARPREVFLVFASNDLSNPSTMFGHTLLRTNVADVSADQYLLAHAINYAAVVTTESPLVYMFSGLSGGFAGYFSTFPYYDRVKQYVRFENRDLWEYRIKLSDEELQRITWHLWELRDTGSEYYFFTENCSYMLLTLIETAWEDERRPSLEFDGLFPTAIPTDTVRALGKLGVLEAPEFRPSMARSLTHKFDHLAPGVYEWMLDYAAGEAELTDRRLTQLAPQAQARGLVAANDYLNYLFQASKLQREKALPSSRRALVALSQISDRPEFPPGPTAPLAPDRGHETTRLSLGARADSGGTAGVLRFRAAYHDRLDPQGGYLPGAQIETGDLGLLLSENVRVSDFRVASVQSLAPWDRAFRPWLWQASGGLRRYGLDAYAADPQSRLGYYLDGGAGYALGNASRWQLYGFSFLSADLNRDLLKGYALAGGLRTGISAAWPGWTQELQVDWLAPVSGAAQTQLRASAEAQWQLASRHGLRLSLHRNDYSGQLQRSAELRWNYYF